MAIKSLCRLDHLLIRGGKGQAGIPADGGNITLKKLAALFLQPPSWHRAPVQLFFLPIPPPSTPWLLPLPFSVNYSPALPPINTRLLLCVCVRTFVCVPGSHLGHLAGLYKYHTGGGSLTGFSQLAGAKEQGCWRTHIR